MPDYATPRPDWIPGGDDAALEEWMTQRYRSDPTYRIPNGYSVKDGRVVRDEPAFLLRHPWLIPVLGAAGGIGLGAAAGTGLLAGAGGAGAAASPGAYIGADVANTAAAAGGAGAAGTGSGITSGIGGRLLTAGAITGLQGLGQKFGANQPMVPPEVQELLKLQKQQVEMQNQRMQLQNPLFASIIQMAMSRLPTAMQQPTGQVASPAQQDVVSEFARRRSPSYG